LHVKLIKIANTSLERSVPLVFSRIYWTHCSCCSVCQIRL